MSVKITSSGRKNRYVEKIQKVQEKDDDETGLKTNDSSTERNSKLIGRSKRNMWLDYPDEPFLKEHNPSGLSDMTSFKIKFPQHRELYFKTHEKMIQNEFDKHHIKLNVNYSDGEVIVSTTNETYDPFIIVKSKLLIKCICRGVPIEKGKDLLKDDIFCDIIHMKQLCRNEKIFKKRRKRLFGPNGSTLKAIEILTNTFIIIMGGTVTAIGSVEDCREVRRLVEDCMFNKHPIYRIKELMITNKYKNDPDMKEKDWSKFLPQFKKPTRNKRKRKKKLKRKHSFVLPAPKLKKVDRQLESGEYFVKERERIKRRKEMRKRGIQGKKSEKRGKMEKKRKNVIDKNSDWNNGSGYRSKVTTNVVSDIDDRLRSLQNSGAVNKKKRKRNESREGNFFIDKRPKKKIKRE